MFYIRFHDFRIVEISENCPSDVQWIPSGSDVRGSGWISSRDLKSMEDAVQISAELESFTNRRYLPVDAGAGVYPRFRVIQAPKIGDKVSRSFNGDTYPCGEIIRITPSWQIRTSSGVKFLRYRETGGWREACGSFFMIYGDLYEQNPHF